MAEYVSGCRETGQDDVVLGYSYRADEGSLREFKFGLTGYVRFQ